MDSMIQKSLYTAILRVLKPLVRIFLRNGITVGVLTSMLRQTYVEVAQQELLIPGKKQSKTRIATLTGLSRKEVGNICDALKKDNPAEHYSIKRTNRSARVVSQWIQDPDFITKNGKPASLCYDEGKNNFIELVKRSGADVPPGPILDELIRSGMAKRLRNNNISLLKTSYVPDKDNVERFSMLGTHVSDLIKTIDHNLSCDPDQVYFQRKAMYSDIPREELEKLQKKVFKIANDAVLDVSKTMAQSDRDTNPSVKGSGQMQVGLGMFYFENEIETPEDVDK